MALFTLSKMVPSDGISLLTIGRLDSGVMGTLAH